MGGGYPSSHGREIFANSCMKTAFSRTLKAIIRGSLCRGIDQFPPLFLFLLNLSQTFFFFFLSFLSVFLLFPPFFIFPFPPPLFSLFFPFLFSFFWSPVRQGGLCPPCPPPLGTLLDTSYTAQTHIHHNSSLIHHTTGNFYSGGLFAQPKWTANSCAT